MDHAARGATALKSSDALTAVAEYTKALVEHPHSPDYFIQRSTAFTRLTPPYGPRHDLALQDAEYAVLLGTKRAKREKIQAAQQRRVIALNSLGRYGDAAFLLQTMEKWRSKDSKKDQMEGQMWKAKIEQNKKKAADGDAKKTVTVQENPDLELPSETVLQKTLQGQLKRDGTFKFTGEAEPTQERSHGWEDLKDLRSQSFTSERKASIVSLGPNESTESIPATDIKVDKEATITIDDTNAPAPVAPQASNPTISKIRHEWYQSNQTVTLTIYAKGVPKDKTEVELSSDSVFISFPHPANTGTSFTFTLDPLFASIDPSKSKHNVMSTKVELVLHKQVPGQKWQALEGSSDAPIQTPTAAANEDVAAQSTTATSTGPSYPTSSRSGPKNWDKLASDLATKGKKKKKPAKEKSSTDKTEAQSDSDGDDSDSGIDSDYGGDPADAFFKKLYAGADDDTRRAMMKSYQESNGTSLSTNWTEVGKGRVEPVPPRDD
ncbi:MAG: hypothetical protein Q9160_003156 [Pyrenula sp. 1 TL-2023]